MSLLSAASAKEFGGMRTSEQINELAEALSKAQGEIKDATMDAKNPHFKNEYATLDSILKEIRPVFSKYGLSFVQWPVTKEDKEYYLITRLMHKSGQWMEAELGLILFKVDMQGIGSATTYARRYSIQSIAGINQERDDDGQSISSNNQAQPFNKAPAPAPKPKNMTPVTPGDIKKLLELAETRGIKGEGFKEFMQENFHIASSKDMTMEQWGLAMDVLKRIREVPAEHSL